MANKQRKPWENLETITLVWPIVFKNNARSDCYIPIYTQTGMSQSKNEILKNTTKSFPWNDDQFTKAPLANGFQINGSTVAEQTIEVTSASNVSNTADSSYEQDYEEIVVV
jgi:hypothetical protein